MTISRPRAGWTRLGYTIRDEHYRDGPYTEQGLQARIADPLWLLARQWQVGEFQGEDAGTPVMAEGAVIYAQIAAWSHQPLPTGPLATEDLQGYPSAPLLEPRVEREQVSDTLHARMEAGRQFLRRLRAAGLSRLQSTFQDAFPITISEDLGLSLSSRSELMLLARRALDGKRLLDAPTTDNGWLPAELDLSGVNVNMKKLRRVLGDWRAWMGRRFSEPTGESAPAWRPERMEYALSVGGKGLAGGEGQRVLTAPEYHGGELDWYTFDVSSAPGSTLFGGGLKLRKGGLFRDFRLVPGPVRFRGMAASRWWQLEDGNVYFGGLGQEPEDTARRVIAAFAVVFGDDWFVLPVQLPCGILSRVGNLSVRDSFGVETILSSLAARDAQNPPGSEARPWRFFEVTGDRSPEDSHLCPLLFLPPALASRLESAPVEEVAFLRDELTNLVWGIERTVEGPTGSPVDRNAAWARGEEDRDPERSDEWKYRLAPTIPPNWIPFVPVRLGDLSAGRPEQVRLQRARMEQWDLSNPHVGPKGKLLDPSGPLFICEEEVPRGGLRVTRTWQLARDVDGSVVLWMGRQKRPGPGERSSHLVYDKIEKAGEG